jgi:glycosyltransferase involved in cell wall biosynthesis
MARIVAVFDASNYSYEIICVDDSSRDQTPRLIEKACRDNRHFSALYHSKNLGRGKTVSDGIRSAKGTVVGYIDIDCEVDPVYIPTMISMIIGGASDVVIGKRYYRTSPKAVIREILSRGYQWLSDKMVGTKGLDTETGYKFFSRKKILPLLAKATNPGWFWDTEIMVYALRAHLHITEVPVLFLRRFDKQSSVHIVSDTIQYLIHLWKFRRTLDR